MTDVNAGVRREMARFRRALPELLRGPLAGKWVVFWGGAVSSAHDSADEARRAGTEAHGRLGGQVVVRVAEERPAPVGAAAALVGPAPSGWNDPAEPPADDEDCVALLRSAVHGRRVFPATHDVRPGVGWHVDVSSACWATRCEVEEHRFDWEKRVAGWLPLPGLDGAWCVRAGEE